MQTLGEYTDIMSNFFVKILVYIFEKGFFVFEIFVKYIWSYEYYILEILMEIFLKVFCILNSFY